MSWSRPNVVPGSLVRVFSRTTDPGHWSGLVAFTYTNPDLVREITRVISRCEHKPSHSSEAPGTCPSHIPSHSSEAPGACPSHIPSHSSEAPGACPSHIPSHSSKAPGACPSHIQGRVTATPKECILSWIEILENIYLYHQMKCSVILWASAAASARRPWRRERSKLVFTPRYYPGDFPN